MARLKPRPNDGVLQPSRHRAPHAAEREPVEARRADHHAQQRHRARHRRQLRRATERRPAKQPIAPPVQRRQPCEEPEVHAERIRAVAPRRDSVDAHADQLHDGVGEREDRQRPRVIALDVAQLHPDEGEDPQRRGPTAQALRVGKRLGERLAGHARRRPTREPADRPPRIERPEHVARQERDARDPDPEQHVDDRRQQVVARLLRAGQPGVHHDRERGNAERAAQHIQQPWQADERPLAHGLQPRARPQRRQADERHDEDGCGRPREQPARNRQVLLADQPVRQSRSRPRQPRRSAGRRHQSARASHGCAARNGSSETTRRLRTMDPPSEVLVNDVQPR